MKCTSLNLALSVLFFLMFPISTSLCLADYIYQEPTDFIKEVFNGNPPNPKTINITGEIKNEAAKILDHLPKFLRVRYWKNSQRSAWILEEIGKTKPITAGFVIVSSQIEDVRILIYRESHGDEVRHNFFTKQFHNSRLDKDTKLNKTIDGISGATLSVDAIKRLATLALYLDSQAL
jgi:FMN-binding domain